MLKLLLFISLLMLLGANSDDEMISYSQIKKMPIAQQCEEIKKDIKNLIDKGIIRNSVHFGSLRFKINLDDVFDDPHYMTYDDWVKEWAGKRKELQINKRSLELRVKEHSTLKDKVCVENGKDILKALGLYLRFAFDKMLEVQKQINRVAKGNREDPKGVRGQYEQKLKERFKFVERGRYMYLFELMRPQELKDFWNYKWDINLYK